MDCPLNNTLLSTFKTLVWRILQVQALTVVSCCGIFPIPSRQYSKRQTRGEEIEKCLDGGLEPSYYFSIFNDAIVALEDDPHDMNAKLQMMTNRQSSHTLFCHLI